MFVNLRRLLRLPVYTESEVKLGRIFDLELDVDKQTVLRYFVKPNFLSAKYFLIAREQVKEIKNDRVIVYDSALKMDLAKSMAEMASEE